MLKRCFTLKCMQKFALKYRGLMFYFTCSLTAVYLQAVFDPAKMFCTIIANVLRKTF